MNDYDDENQLKIKIIGVGGCGCNAINRLAQQSEQFEGIELYAANTDKTALSDVAKSSDKIHTIQLGRNQTNGMGAGAKPDIGKIATEESATEIENAVGDANLLFITAGMGGGTGTGGAPVVAKIAREKKILTIGIVMLPFAYEGAQKLEIANKGIAEMRKYVDVLVVVSNQKASQICGPTAPLQKVFEKADEVLMNSIKGITDIIVNHLLINLDFADICTVIKDKKTAHIGLGSATGENRMFKALRMASNNELLNTTIEHAKYIIVSIVSDYNLTGDEVNKALALIPKVVDEGATIIHGIGFDKNLKDEVHVTIIATGLNGEDTEEQYEEPEQDEEQTAEESIIVGKHDETHIPVEEPQKPQGGKFEDFLKHIQDNRD